MAGDTQITVVGNLVSDPELRYTPTGVAVANFRVASTPRTFDRQANEWKDGDSLFLTCNVWRQAAENVAESLAAGHAGHRDRGGCTSAPTRPAKVRSAPSSRSKSTTSAPPCATPRPRSPSPTAPVAVAAASAAVAVAAARVVVVVAAASAAAARADPAGMVGRPAAVAAMTPGPRTPGSAARGRPTSRRSDPPAAGAERAGSGPLTLGRH